MTFHMPMVPELPVSMLACARLGVVHSEVFGGFSGAACGDRIADSGSRILVTMDGYYRNGELIDHKAKADQAVAAARERGVQVEKVLVWRRHPGQYASKSPMVAGRDFFVDELLKDYRGATVEPVSMPAEAPLFLMYTSGTTARPKGCQHSTGGYLAYVTGTVEVLPGHPSRGHLLVHGRHRLDHRPLVHRLRPALARDDERHVRGRADLSRRRPSLADRRAAGREHLPHRPDHDPHAAQGRPGRAEEVRLPLQAHDDGGRADRARRLALVLRGRRQARGRHRRHLVADRERRLPGQHAARAQADEAGQLRPGRAGHLPGDLRRERRGGGGRQRAGRQHLHPQPMARHLPDDLGPARAVRADLLRRSTAGTRTARTGATGPTWPATARCRPPTATSGSSAASTT